MSSTESAYRIPEKMYRKFPEQSRQLLNSIVQFIEPKTGETIVDVGTGAGFLAAELAEKVGKSGKVIGFDISRSAIRQAKRIIARKDQRGVLEFRVGDVYSLPLEDDFADVVCCKSLIAAIDNRQHSGQRNGKGSKAWWQSRSRRTQRAYGPAQQNQKSIL